MKEVKTARGRTINMIPIVTKNDTTVAVGNLSVNARGDLLGKGGKVIKGYKQREEVKKVNMVSEEVVGLGQIEEPEKTQYPYLLKSYTRKGKIIEEWEHEDGSIEERPVK